jgi:hypothetical protein
MSKLAAAKRYHQRQSADLDDYKIRLEMIQYIVNKVSLVLKDDWHQHCALTVCVWCIPRVNSLSEYISSRTQCKRSIAHLLLAETHSTQPTNCHLFQMTIDISTADALKVCVECIFHITNLFKYISSRHTVQKKHCILVTGRDIQYKV